MNLSDFLLIIVKGRWITVSITKPPRMSLEYDIILQQIINNRRMINIVSVTRAVEIGT